MPRYQTYFAYPTLNFTAQEELDSVVEEEAHPSLSLI
jgi:hypothetical protein